MHERLSFMSEFFIVNDSSADGMIWRMRMLPAWAPAPLKMNLTPTGFLTIWLGALALLLAIVWAAAREKRKRREALEQLGMETGFLFSAKPDEMLQEKLAEISTPGPQPGRRSRFSNVLQGTAAGVEAMIADRTVGAGKSQQTSTVAAFNLATPLPEFMLVPENLLWRVAEKFGYSDIDIDGAPDFSRRFFLHGKDEAALRALFKPVVTEAFEQLDAKANLYVSGSGQWLVVYRPGRTIPAAEIREFLQKAETVASAIRKAQPSGIFR
jgi:hypothetical protein